MGLKEELDGREDDRVVCPHNVQQAASADSTQHNTTSASGSVCYCLQGSLHDRQCFTCPPD